MVVSVRIPSFQIHDMPTKSPFAERRIKNDSLSKTIVDSLVSISTMNRALIVNIRQFTLLIENGNFVLSLDIADALYSVLSEFGPNSKS